MISRKRAPYRSYKTLQNGELAVSRCTTWRRSQRTKSTAHTSPTSDGSNSDGCELPLDDADGAEAANGSDSDAETMDESDNSSDSEIDDIQALDADVIPENRRLTSVEEAHVLISLLKWEKFGCTKALLNTDLKEHRCLFRSQDKHSVFPHSIHQVRKLSPDVGQSLRLHYICNVHHCVLGIRRPNEATNISFICSSDSEEAHEVPLGTLDQSCVLTATVEEYVRSVLETRWEEVKANILLRGQRCNCAHEVVQGKFYRDCSELNETALTLIVHPDGARVTDSSSLKAYAIHIVLAELRAKSRLTCGWLHTLWVGSDQTMPHRAVLWEPFLKEMRSLQSQGFVMKIQETSVRFRVFATCVVPDAAERFPIAELSTFHAPFGCTRCQKRSETWTDPKNPRSHHQIYRYSDTRDPARTHSDTIKAGEELLAFDPAARDDLRLDARYKGVTGLSPLFCLKKLNVIRSLPVGFMHLFLKGLFPGVCAEILTSDRIKEVDQRTGILDFPNSVSRKPRSFQQLSQMKANEFLVLMTHGLYSFQGIIDENQFQVWALLISLATTATLDVVTESDTEQLREESTLFVKMAQEVFGEKFMRYNVHQVLHLAECIRDFGPMSGYCELSYEDWIGRILRTVKGYNQIPREIANTICFREIITRLLIRLSHVALPDELSEILQELTHSKRHKIATEEDRRTLLGSARTLRWLKRTDTTSYWALREAVSSGEEISLTSSRCKVFQKIILKGYLVSAKESFADKNANAIFYDKNGDIFLLKYAVQFYRYDIVQGPTFLIARKARMLPEKPYDLKWHLPTFAVFCWTDEIVCFSFENFAGIAIEMPLPEGRHLGARLASVLYSMD